MIPELNVAIGKIDELMAKESFKQLATAKETDRKRETKFVDDQVTKTIQDLIKLFDENPDLVDGEDALLRDEYEKTGAMADEFTAILREMKELLKWYDGITSKKLEDIIEFHVRFERILPEIWTRHRD